MGHTSPLEARLCALVAHAAEGMTRQEGNAMVKKLVLKYRDDLVTPDLGKHFRDVYHLDELGPTREWMQIFTEVTSELKEMGLPL
jgi:hypothetical protein